MGSLGAVRVYGLPQGRSLDWQVKAVYSLVLEERDLLAVQPTGAGESLVVNGA